jgi:Family of unknown function (DUF6011)
MNDLKSYHGHKSECDCQRCMDADFTAHLRNSLGIDPAQYSSKPFMINTGQSLGGISPSNGATSSKPRNPITSPQKKKIHVLAAERDLRHLTKTYKGWLDRLGDLSCKQAIELIDVLLSAAVVPDKERKATEAQVLALIGQYKTRDLSTLSDGPRKLVHKVCESASSNKPVLFEDASLVLDLLGTRPFIKEQLVADGFYLYKNGVYKVQTSKRTNRPYALRLDPETGKFDYEKGTIFQLKNPMRLTVDQAAKLGAKWHRCVICGADLTDPESIERGIGPYCAKKL